MNSPATLPDPPAAPSWYRRFGLRNFAYLAFVALMFPLGSALESTGPRSGPDSGAGLMLTLVIWFIGSIAFFAVNALLLLAALAKGQSIATPLLGCALPLSLVIAIFALLEWG